MRFPDRLNTFIATLALLLAAVASPALAVDGGDAEPTTRYRPARLVVDLVDHAHSDTANERAAEILADAETTWEESPPAGQFPTDSLPAYAARATAAGFSVAYDPTYPTPSVARPAIEAAVETWDETLMTNGMPITVWVVWRSFGNPRVLGSGGPNGLLSSDGLPTDHFYPMPLYNVLTGTDHNGSDPEIIIVLNKDLADSGAWHYGSGAPSGGRVDLRSVVTHEVGHGVGFVSSATDESGPIDFTSPPFVYDAQALYRGAPVVDAANVGSALTSGEVSIRISESGTRALHTPSTWQQGTSFSHFVPLSGSLMEPSLESGTTSRTIDAATAGVLRRIGWSTALTVTGPPTVTSRALDGQIERVYLAHLRRRPDRGGFAFWLNQRAGGLPLLDMIAEFQSSTEFVRTYGSLTNREFVTLIYQNVLGRSPDSGGLAHWSGLLDRGVSRAEVTEGFIESAEFVRITRTSAPYGSAEGPIRRLYLAFYGREGAASDVAYWSGQSIGGTSLISIADFFSTSTEFLNRYGNLSDAQFVNLVYLGVLGRSADSAGFDFWMAQLHAGTSRGEMMLEFSQSPEFVRTTGTLP